VGTIGGLSPAPEKARQPAPVPERKSQEGAGSKVLQEPVGEQKLLQAIEEANRVTVDPHTSFRFSIHEATHRIMVKIINEDSGEVIREIPPEKILDLVAGLWELAGILVDERV